MHRRRCLIVLILFLIFGMKVNAAAVQPETVLSQNDTDLLAKLVYAEAGNQSDYGKQLVVDVVLNRMDKQNLSLSEVIYQKGQFSVVSNGALRKAYPDQTEYQAIETETNKRSNYDVYYFTSGGWSGYGVKWKQVGDHYFSTK